ncbi:MAG: hypothetical protein ABSF83_13850 [Nitrososphaerales archaeon]|jgi:hypothetical protein
MTREAASNPTHYGDWSALLGFLPERDALEFIHRAVPSPLTTDDEWLARIRTARDAASGVPSRAGTRPATDEIPSRLAGRLATLEGEPTFQELLPGTRSHRFAMVELSKLRCYQVNLDLEYLASLARSVPAAADEEGTMRFCLPLREERKVSEVLLSSNPEANSVSLISEDLGLRLMGTVSGEYPASDRKFTGFVYGFGTPLFSVTEYRGAFTIKNGYHRALALLRKGHVMAPALVMATENPSLVTPARAGYFPIETITSERPPLLSDFDSPAAVTIPRRRSRVVITMHAEAQVTPV